MKKDSLKYLVEKCSKLKDLYNKSNMYDDNDESTFWEALKDFVRYSDDISDDIRKSIPSLKKISGIKINIDNLKSQENAAKLNGLPEKASYYHRSILENHDAFIYILKEIEKKSNDFLEKNGKES